MPDLRAAFLEAIRADPDDDVARLVYADWLDEHGDADRAESTRLQIPLARGRCQGTQAEASRRVEAILNRRRHEWLPGCEGVDWMVGFRRGFAETVEVPPGSTALFTAKAAQLFDVADVQELTIDPDHGDWRALLAVRQLRGLRCLRARHLDEGATAALTASPHLTGLRELDLSKGRLGADGVRTLLRAPLIGQIASLSLAGMRDIENYDWDDTNWTDYTVPNVGVHGAILIAGSPKLRGVRRLDLSWNRLNYRAAATLAGSGHLGGLVELRIAERGSVEHDGIDKSQREEASPLMLDGVRLLRDRFGAALRVWSEK